MQRATNGHDPEQSLDAFLKQITIPPAPSALVESSPTPSGRVLSGLLEALGPLLQASIFCVDRRERKIIYTSEYLLASMGYASWQIRGISLSDLERMVHPRDRRLAAEHDAALTSEPGLEMATHEVRLRTAAGRWRWIETTERVMTRTPDGRAHLTLGVAHDVTERRKLRRALSATSKELLESEENERRRIARDLHDSTGQLLAAAVLMLSDAEARAGGEALTPIRRARKAISSAQQDIRTLSYLLHPPQLASEGLPATLASFAEGFGRRSGLDVRLDVEGEPTPLGPAAELALFRVAQEALMNVHTHAKARTAWMRLRYGAAATELEVEDDGVGLQASPADLPGALRTGVGLSSMRARMAQLGGRLTLSRQARGLRVHARLPRDKPA